MKSGADAFGTQKLLPQSSSALPLNVVYDCGSIDGYVEETFGYKLVTQLMNDHRLSKYLIGLRNGKVAESEDETRIMRELVGTYGTFSQGPKDKSLDGTARTHTSSVSDGDVVVSTTTSLVKLETDRSRFSLEPLELLVLISLTNSAPTPASRKYIVLFAPLIRLLRKPE